MDEAKILNVSEFFSGNISPTVLGAFLRRTEYIGTDYIFTYFSYRKSKFALFDEVSYEQYIDSINGKSGVYPYWQKNDSTSNDVVNISSKYKGVYILRNDTGIDLSDETQGNNFTNRLINKIRSQVFTYDYTLEDDRKDFLRGYMDVSMSYDGSGFLACDYYCQSQSDIRKISILMDYGLMKPEYFNFNTRLTAETTEKAEQIRISWKYYIKEIGTYSQYRIECLKGANVDATRAAIEQQNGVFYLDIDYVEFDDRRKNEKITSFVTKYQQFQNIAYGYRIEGNQDIESINEYRIQFGVDEADASERRQSRRQQIIKQVYDEEDDVCVCCKNQYNINDRSFLMHRRVNGLVTQRYYFEIHHAISFSNGRDDSSNENILDVIENLVKVCPTCHSCMTARRGLIDDVKNLISNMLDNSDKVRNFAEGYFETNDRNELIEKIYEVLH